MFTVSLSKSVKIETFRALDVAVKMTVGRQIVSGDQTEINKNGLYIVLKGERNLSKRSFLTRSNIFSISPLVLFGYSL